MVATQLRAWPYWRNEVGIVGSTRKPIGFVKSDTAIEADTSVYPVRGIPTFQQRRLPCTTASFSSSWSVPSLGWFSRHVHVDVKAYWLTAVSGRGRNIGQKWELTAQIFPLERYNNVTLDSTRRVPHWGVSQRIHYKQAKPHTFPIIVGPANVTCNPTSHALLGLPTRTIQEYYAYHLRVWHPDGGGLILMWLGPTSNPAILCTRQVIPETISSGDPLMAVQHSITARANPTKSLPRLQAYSLRGIPNHWRTK